MNYIGIMNSIGSMNYNRKIKDLILNEPQTRAVFRKQLTMHFSPKMNNSTKLIQISSYRAASMTYDDCYRTGVVEWLQRTKIAKGISQKKSQFR